MAIKELQDKIAALEVELDQLWRDEGIVNLNQEVPLNAWGKPQPMLCRECRKEPVMITKKQREVDAIVGGRVAKVLQEYYLYVESMAWGERKIWCGTCAAKFKRENGWVSNVSRDNYC